MRKLLVLGVLLCGCYVDISPFPDCVYDIDCMPGEVCVDGFCTGFFNPLPPGARTVDCQCWGGNHYIYDEFLLGEPRLTNLCESNYDIVQMCMGCCEYDFWSGYCIEPVLGRFCM